MAIPIIILPYDDPTALANVRISPADVRIPIAVGANPAAAEIWRFGGGRLSLGGRLNGGAASYLVPQFPTPVFPDNSDGLHNYMTTPEGDGCGLLLPFDDSTDFTALIVFRRTSPSTLTYLFGNATATAADGGFFLYATATGVWNVTSRGMTTATSAVPWPTGLAVGTFGAVGISQSSTSRTVLVHGGSPVTVTNAAGVTRTVSNNSAAGTAVTRKMTLGNQFYTSGTGHAVDVKALEFFTTALSPTDLAAALANTVLGCAAEGVTVF